VNISQLKLRSEKFDDDDDNNNNNNNNIRANGLKEYSASIPIFRFLNADKEGQFHESGA
jgi:hypothetical protein